MRPLRLILAAVRAALHAAGAVAAVAALGVAAAIPAGWLRGVAVDVEPILADVGRLFLLAAAGHAAGWLAHAAGFLCSKNRRGL